MAADDQVPPDIQTLASVLVTIMAGENDPDLSTLPDELSDPVRELLSQL